MFEMQQLWGKQQEAKANFTNTALDALNKSNMHNSWSKVKYSYLQSGKLQAQWLSATN